MKIVADRDIPFLRGVLEPFAEMVYLDGKSISHDDVRDADALIIRTRTRCDARLLDGTAVRCIATATIGTDHIDLDYCRGQGIAVENSAGCNARGVLQWVGAVLVKWTTMRGLDPSALRLGVIGVGHVGSLVADYARMWGFDVLCCDPPREEREHLGFLTAEEVVASADIVTFHTPLDAGTYHLAEDRLLSCGHQPFVINASRGEVVDTSALLASGCECAIDTWEHEPDIDQQLLSRAIVATPHVAGYSLQGKANAASMAVAAVSRHFGLPTSGWYPEGVEHVEPRAIGWKELCNTIGRHYDIDAESTRLKARPEEFEAMRNGYAYRNEYF